MDEKDKAKYLGDVEYFSAKLEADPDSVLFVPLAKAYLKLERFDDAVAVLTAGIDKNTDVLSAKTMLAKAYLGLGKMDDAKAILTEVQVIDRNNYLASKLMGDLLRNEDNIKKALISYRNALMVAPEDIELKNLIEELMDASGFSASELVDDRNLMDADDEMLDQLGEELAEEVRQEVGEAELGTADVSSDEVSKAVDEIVGEDLSDTGDDMSLSGLDTDGSDDFDDELEEEMIASFDDEIVPPTPSSLEDDSADTAAVKLDDAVMDMAGDDSEAPDDEAVKALAAELGADLGLEPADGAAPPVSPPDEIDEALSGLFDGVDEAETDAPPEDTDALLKELNASAEDVTIEANEEPDVESMLDQVAEEKEALSHLLTGGLKMQGRKSPRMLMLCLKSCMEKI